jgi:intracellular multiplication protein IcmS
MKLQQGLHLIAKALNAHFILKERPVGYDEVFSEVGLLPAIARRSDQLCSLCLGYGIGVSFEEVEGSLLGVKVIFDDATPNILRYMCMTDVLFEIISHAPSTAITPLDELLYD